MSQQIALTLGYVAIVDDADYAYLNQFKWYVMATGPHRKLYAARWINGQNLYMHVDIMNVVGVDHANGNGLDNCRSNLRVATHMQQMWNFPSHQGSSSQFKGVWWSKRSKKWQAGITCEGHKLHLGYYTDEIEAARAYDDAARAHFGSFARLNGV